MKVVSVTFQHQDILHFTITPNVTLLFTEEHWLREVVAEDTGCEVNNDW